MTADQDALRARLHLLFLDELEEHVERIEDGLDRMADNLPELSADTVGELFRSVLESRAQVREEKAIALEPASQPEPDLALVRSRTDFYADSHPTAADVLLQSRADDACLIKQLGRHDLAEPILRNLYRKAATPDPETMGSLTRGPKPETRRSRCLHC